MKIAVITGASSGMGREFAKGIDAEERLDEIWLIARRRERLEELAPVFAGVYRALRPGGAFALNIEHPVFTSGVNEDWQRDAAGRILHWPVDRYFEPGARRTLFCGCEVTKYHHSLAQILGGLLEAGFTLAAVDEARPSPEMLAADPAMYDELRRPIMLLVRAEKR